MDSGLRSILGGLLILAVGRPLGAQRPVVIDVGFSGAHFPDEDLNAFGPYARLMASGATPAMFGSIDGGVIAAFGATSGFGTARGGIRSGTGAGWNGVLDAELTGVAGSNTNGAAGAAVAGAQVVWRQDVWGVWLRGSSHVSQRTNSTLYGAGADAGLWGSWPLAQVTATVAHEATRAELYTGKLRTGFAGTTPVNYSEGSVALHTEADRVSLDVTASVRRDPDAARLWDSSLLASSTSWITESVAFVFTASRQLPDWVRGADAVTEVSVGMRFRQPMPIRARAFHVLPLVLVADGSEAQPLRIQAPGARSVDVKGDFTDWEPHALTRDGNVFASVAKIGSGPHRLLLRIDGGAWRAAINTPLVDDEFGGKVGLLVLP